MNHELKTLESLRHWELEHRDQDVRGLPLLGPDRTVIGQIDDMMVDRDEERVAAVRLVDGRCFPAGALRIEGDAVFLETGAEPIARSEPGEEIRIPIAEERLVVGKREVDRGAIRVRTRVVERPVSEEVRLRDETVEVERRPVDRRVDNADALFRDRDVEMTERDEEAVVAKEARVKEELVVRKEAEQHRERITDTVRKTEVDIDETRAGDRNPASRR